MLALNRSDVLNCASMKVREKPVIRFRAATQADFEWFVEQTSYWPGPQFNGIVAYSDAGVMGMVGFDSWTPRTVMAHFAIPRPRCLLPLWTEATGYLAQHGRKAVLGATPSNNERALKVIRKLGWKELYRIKDAWDTGIDMVISEYTINER